MKSLTPIAKTPSGYKILSTVLALGISLVVFLLKDQIGLFRHFGYLGIFVVSFIGNATILLPAPVLFTVAVLGSALSPVFVGITASLGAALGESVGYFLGVGGSVLIEKSTRYHRVKSYIDKYGVWALFILAALPNPLFDLAGLMAGALGISYRQFFHAAWAGTFLKYTLVSFIGYGVL